MAAASAAAAADDDDDDDEEEEKAEEEDEDQDENEERGMSRVCGDDEDGHQWPTCKRNKSPQNRCIKHT